MDTIVYRRLKKVPKNVHVTDEIKLEGFQAYLNPVSSVTHSLLL